MDASAESGGEKAGREAEGRGGKPGAKQRAGGEKAGREAEGRDGKPDAGRKAGRGTESRTRDGKPDAGRKAGRQAEGRGSAGRLRGIARVGPNGSEVVPCELWERHSRRRPRGPGSQRGSAHARRPSSLGGAGRPRR